MNRALELEPNNNDAKNILFQSYYHRKDFSKAIEILDLLINDGKELATHYFNYGYCYFKMGERKKAEENKKKASDLDSGLAKEKYR